MGRSRFRSTCASDFSETNSLESLEFIGSESVTLCNDVGLDSWTCTDPGMAFSLLEYVIFFPNFLLLGAGSDAGPAVPSSGAGSTTDSGAYSDSTTRCSTTDSGSCSDSTTPFLLISGPNVIFGSMGGSSSSLTFSP